MRAILSLLLLLAAIGTARAQNVADPTSFISGKTLTEIANIDDPTVFYFRPDGQVFMATDSGFQMFQSSWSIKNGEICMPEAGWPCARIYGPVAGLYRKTYDGVARRRSILKIEPGDPHGIEASVTPYYPSSDELAARQAANLQPVPVPELGGHPMTLAPQPQMRMHFYFTGGQVLVETDDLFHGNPGQQPDQMTYLVDGNMIRLGPPANDTLYLLRQQDGTTLLHSDSYPKSNARLVSLTKGDTAHLQHDVHEMIVADMKKHAPTIGQMLGAVILPSTSGHAKLPSTSPTTP